MEIKTILDSAETVKVTKSYQDFQESALTKQITVWQPGLKAKLLDLNIEVTEPFAMNQASNLKLTLPTNVGSLPNLTKRVFSKTFNANYPKGQWFGPSDSFQVTLESIQLLAWSFGSSLNRSRGYPSCGGTQTATTISHGYNSSYIQITELFNGTTWTDGNSCNYPRWGVGSCGTQSAMLVACGYYGGSGQTSVESFNGTTWTTKAACSVARYGCALAGTTTAASLFQGYPGSYVTEHWNGTAWSTGGNVSNQRGYSSGCGVQDSCLYTGGSNNSQSNFWSTTEEYNGTAWSTGGNNTMPRDNLCTIGLKSDALSFSGYNGSYGIKRAETYDDTSWTQTDDLLVGIGSPGGCGSSSAAVCTGGFTGSGVYTAVTQLRTGRPALPLPNLSNLVQGSLTFTFTTIKYQN